MTLTQWLGMGATAALLAAIVFAFRQGEKVKPSGDQNVGPAVGGGPDSGIGH